MNKSAVEDKKLIQFKTLYKANAPKLIFYACKYVDTSTAEDLVQDVFLKVWQNRIFMFIQEGLKSYLYSAVQHACLDYLRHQEVKENYMNAVVTRLKIEEIYYNDEYPALLTEDERLLRVYKEIDRLPDKCREIFMMSYLEERKMQDIASCLNLSPRTVEAQLYKALKTLRSVLAITLSFLIFFWR